MKKIVSVLSVLLFTFMMTPAFAQTSLPINGLTPGGLVQTQDQFYGVRPSAPGQNFYITFGSAASQSIGTSGPTLGLLNTPNTYSGLQSFSSGDLTAADAVFTGGSITLPSGTTSARPSSPVNGMIRYNTSLTQYEAYASGAWSPLGSGSGSGITALTGDGTASGTGSVPFTLATVNSNVGTFGSTSTVPQITTNGKGLITGVASVTITPAAIGAAPTASPTFTGTVTLPAGTVLNGVTLTTGGSSTTFLNAAGTYSTPAGGGNVSGPGSSTNLFVPQWSGTTGTVLAAGLGIGTSGNSVLLETDSGGHIVSSVVPTLNQNTTGTAANITGVAAIANGGTGQSTQQAALNALAGATTSGLVLRGNGTNIVLGAIQASDVPTLNQNTTGNAATVTTNANLTGDVTSVGNATTLSSATVTGKALTGFSASAGTVSAADTILSAFNKLVGNIALLAPSASPTFSGTVTLPAATAVNGVTLSSTGSSTLFLTQAGTYATPSGSGGLTVGSTSITSGTTTKVLFDNAGILGEYTISGTSSVAMTGSPTFTGTLNAAAITASGVVTELNSVATGTGADTLPVGTSAQRPGSPTSGMIRVNSSPASLEAYFSSAWNTLINSITAGSPDISVSCTGGTCTLSAIAPINNQSGSTTYAVASSDMGKVLLFNSSSSIAVSIAQAGTTGFELNKSFIIINLGTGTLTLTPTTSNINGSTTLTLGTAQGGQLFSDGTNYDALLGKSTGGSGVTSFTGDSLLYSNSGSTGGVTLALNTQTANKVMAGPTTGAAAAPTFRSLVGADLPNPGASSLGGIESLASTSHQWINTISTSGVPSSTQPATSDLSDLGTFSLNTTGTATAKAFVSPPSTLTLSTATFTPVAMGSNTYRVVLVHASCPCTVANPSGSLVDGEKVLLEVWQSSTGSDLVNTYGTTYDFGTAGAPTLSTSANKGDFLAFSYSAQNSKLNYLGVAQGF